jgi:hypothetical protein
MSGRSRFNKKGDFLYRVGKKAIFLIEEPQVTKINPETDGIDINGKKIAPWFEGTNTHPSDIRTNYIKKTTVLKASISYKQRLIVGQGIFVARIKGYNANGLEILEPVVDPEITTFCNSRMISSYLALASKNYATWENLFPEMILNKTHNKILGLYEKSCLVSRWGMRNDKNVIENAYFYGDWSQVDAAKMVELPVLNYDQPLEDLQTRKDKLTNFIFLNSMYDSEYYMVPDYETAIDSKWVNLAQKTPIFLNAAYDNAMNILYHIKIPKEYIDFKFPESEFKTIEERFAAIDRFLDDLETELTTVEKAKKSLTNISVQGPDGKPIYWEIEVIDHKQTIDKDILASDAADSQITNTFLINDAVFLKKGGMGQGAGSGSDIREAHLINVSLVKTDRDRIVEPLGLIRDFNGAPWASDMVFRFRDTILTTLNTGKSTEVIVS